MRKRKLIFSVLLIILLGAILSLYYCDAAVENTAKGHLYSQPANTPYNKVGLLLGTAKYLSSGTPNLYYSYRIDAAVALYKAGKIKYIVISGDNSRKDYNEPAMMKEDLVAAGVDSSSIFLDYAGFRTFDSIIRLREIFNQQSATIISQPFHNKRAIYIAQREGINAIGFNARDVHGEAGLKIKIRERMARVKVFADYLFNKQPKFLGEKVPIPQ